MTSSNSQNLQLSDWSVSPSVTFHGRPSFNRENQINIRTNNVNPIDHNQYPKKDHFKTIYTKQCKPSQWWSSTPPLVRGLLLGVLTGCCILAIILPLWLIKTSTSQTNSAIPVLRWNTTGITVAGLVNNPGNANNQLNTPYDVIFDHENNLYIADYSNHRIQKYLFGTSTGKTVAGNATQGSSQSQLYKPTRVIIDSNGDFYISDAFNHRIQFWRNGATSGTTVAGITGVFGNASNQLFLPYGIALNPTSGTLYIADNSNHRIMSYPTGTNNGTLILGGIGPGTNNTQLYSPVGLHFDSFSNSLVIANYGANNIVRYGLDTGANGYTLLAGNINGSFGTTSTSFKGPFEMILDPMGNMYVAERDNYRIQFFPAGQLSGTTIVGITGVSGDNATTLRLPRSVRLDSQLNLYVIDSLNHRIQKFLRY